MGPDPEVEELEVRLVLEAIHARYGYDLRDYARPSMRRRMLSALARSEAANLGDLQHRLLADPGLFGVVLDQLMVQVSEMFRDPSFFLVFRREIVPLLRTYPMIKIWHAGCASGEEVYTTAILLAEEGLYDRRSTPPTSPGRRWSARRTGSTPPISPAGSPRTTARPAARRHSTAICRRRTTGSRSANRCGETSCSFSTTWSRISRPARCR